MAPPLPGTACLSLAIQGGSATFLCRQQATWSLLLSSPSSPSGKHIFTRNPINITNITIRKAGLHHEQGGRELPTVGGKLHLNFFELKFFNLELSWALLQLVSVAGQPAGAGRLCQRRRRGLAWLDWTELAAVQVTSSSFIFTNDCIKFLTGIFKTSSATSK